MLGPKSLNLGLRVIKEDLTDTLNILFDGDITN